MPINNKHKIILAPSILGIDYLNIQSNIEAAIKNGAQWLHFDVMDSIFVDNLALGTDLFKTIRKQFPKIFIDVHLMVANPEKWTYKFAEMGADLVTFHHESLKYRSAKKMIRNLSGTFPKLHIGVAIKPKTNVEQIYEFLPDVDVALVMSVEPGWGGQGYIDGSEDKIAKLKKYCKDNFLDCFIEVDGGINDKSIEKVVNAEVDVVVAGSYVFKNKKGIKAACDSILKYNKKNSI